MLEAAAQGGATLSTMSTTVRVHARAALGVLGALAATVVAAVTGPSAGSILAAVAAVGLAGAVGMLARRLIAVAPRRRIMVGSRSRRHRESIDRAVEPRHPDTAGKPRPRAPGAVHPAA